MKKCSFCGQEIPSDEPLCRFCNHAQVDRTSRQANQISRNATRTKVTLVIALACGVAAALFTSSLIRTSEQDAVKPLGVSGLRRSRGIDIVNQEAEPLTQCTVRLSDRGRSDQWTAVIQKLAPTERVTITWGEFRNASGSAMADQAAETARYATVNCESHRDIRKDAAISFR